MLQSLKSGLLFPDDWVRHLFLTSRDALLVIDPSSGCIEEANEAAGELMRDAPVRLRGCQLPDYLDESERSKLDTWLTPGIGPSAVQSVLFLRRDGSRLLCQVAVRELPAEPQFLQLTLQPEPSSVSLATDQRDAGAEQEFIRLDEFLEIADGFAWEYDLQTRLFTHVSERVVDLFGYPKERWLTDSNFFFGIVHPDDRVWVLDHCAAETAAGRDHVMEYRLVGADGVAHRMRDAVLLRRNTAGEVTHLRGMMVDLSARNRFQELLRLRQERYQQLFQESPVALWEVDWSGVRRRLVELQQSGVTRLRSWLKRHPEEVAALQKLIRVLDVNRAALRLYGAETRAELAEKFPQVVRPDAWPSLIEHLHKRFSGVTRFEGESVHHTLSGERLDVFIAASVPSGLQDTWEKIYFSVTDITRRRQAERLRDSHHRVLESLAVEPDTSQVLKVLLQELEEQSPRFQAAIYQAPLTARSRPIACSPRVLPLLNEAGGVAGFNVMEAVEAGSSIVLLGRGAGQHSPQSSFEESESGTERRDPLFDEFFSAQFIPVHDAGQPPGLLVLFRSRLTESPHLSARSVAHEEEVVKSFRELTRLVLTHARDRATLANRTAELQSIFEAWPDAMARVDERGTVLNWYSGQQSAWLTGMLDPRAIHHLRDVGGVNCESRFRKAMERIALGSPLESVEFSLTGPGETGDFEARFLSLRGTRDQLVLLRCVTPLKETERQLHRVSQRFRYLFERSPDAIFVESAEGMVLEANPAACELHGMTQEELVGSSVFQLVPPEDHDRVRHHIQEVLAGRMDQFEGRSLRRDGAILSVSIRVSVIHHDGEPAFLYHVRDMTARKREEVQRREQQQQLAHIARLSLMGQFVGAIAHEIRQPLWAISTFADVCLETIGKSVLPDRLERAEDLVRRIVNEARRASVITTRMFEFVRKGRTERLLASLHEIAHDAIAISDSLMRAAGIQVICRVPTSLPHLLCDRVLIEQTLINLLTNASEAMAGLERDDRRIEIDAALCHDVIEVHVRDNGPGLPDGTTPEQLFEGYFTTSRSGMGIGLALCRSFVEDHGGRISAESRPEGGMAFHLTLRLDGGGGFHDF